MHGIEAVVERARAMIDQHGWMVQGVFPTAEDHGPPYCYTVGLTECGLPELCMTGLPPEVARVILNTAASQARDSGEPFYHGQRLSHLGSLLKNNVTLAVVEGLPSEEGVWPGMAYRFYDPFEVRLQQLVWPDDEGRFPWDEGFARTQFVIKNSPQN